MMRHIDVFLRQLYKEQHERLFKAAYRMLGSAELAQDLVQDVFLFALFHEEELHSHPSPEGWLMLTLKNLVQNERRNEERHSLIPLESVEPFQGKPPDLSLELYLPKGLSTAERTILLWRFEQQMEYREIANRLGISEAGCRSRVYRAVKQCRKLLQEK